MKPNIQSTAMRPFPEEICMITTLSSKPALMNDLFRDDRLQVLKKEQNKVELKFCNQMGFISANRRNKNNLKGAKAPFSLDLLG